MLKKGFLLVCFVGLAACGDAPKKGGGTPNNANNANNVNNVNNVNNTNSRVNNVNNLNNPVNNVNNLNNPVNNTNNANNPVNNTNNANNPPNNVNNPPNNVNNSPGFCANDRDTEIIFGTQTETVAQECAFGCFQEADPDSCNTMCIANETGLSDGCSSCYSQSIGCILEFCLTACLEDPNSFDCLECQADNGCDELFEFCAGVPRR